MKIKSSSFKNVIALFSLVIAFSACKKEQISCDTTYEKDIKPILEKSCAYSGCHSGGTTAGKYIPASAKNFTSYADLKTSIDNGKLNDRAIVRGDMPSPQYTPEGYPKTLSQEEKDKISCWIDAGAPEK